MSKIITIHTGKTEMIEKIPTCRECDEFKSELWECNTCGDKFCADHIINDGNNTDDIKYVCIGCHKQRFGGDNE